MSNLPRLSFSLFMAFAMTGCNGDHEADTYTVDVTEYSDPPPRLALVDDQPNPSAIPAFDPELVHSVPVGDWELNLSRTLFRLDVPVIRPDEEPELLVLRPHYKAAIDAARESGAELLPSVNLIDGKAKQFDDGLYAALDLAHYAGHAPALRSHLELMQAIAAKLGPESVAAPYLAAGLSLAGIEVPCDDMAAKDRYLREFEASPLRSKPLGFYNWTPKLQECYRFLKFFQQPFGIEQDGWPEVPAAMATVLRDDPALAADYRRAIDFYARLTNPLVSLSLLDVTTANADAAVAAARQQKAGLRSAVGVFPASTSREQRLFERLFPLGFPEGLDLMPVLMDAIRKGQVDLTPTEESGWYDHQCYALETFLLPQRGDEARKLPLSARYKQRMFDAFAALITKRRETHIRGLEAAAASEAAAPEPLGSLSPRLRLEPNATYYLRTARAYTVLQSFLRQAIGDAALAQVNGLRADGNRGDDLATELAGQIELFYGCYLLAMEDVGLPPSLPADELTDPTAAKDAALHWLRDFATDPDLAVDTRIVVPIAVDPLRGTTQLWATTGVRLARLTVEFNGEAPSVRAVGGDGKWQLFAGGRGSTEYLIPVDEFLSVEIPSLNCPTRSEFRSICDRAPTAKEIQAALRKWKQVVNHTSTQ